MTKATQKYKLIPYQTPNGIVIDAIKYQNDIWMTQKQMAQLFDCSTDNISLHLKNIFEIGELDKNRVTEDFSVTAQDGKKYNTHHYNRRAIFHVGYRVNSKMGVMFRNWASDVLEEKVTGQDKKQQIEDRATKVKYLLQRKGITLKQVAKELGFTNVHLSYCLHGHSFNIIIEEWINNLFEKEEENTNNFYLTKNLNKVFNKALNGDFESYKTVLNKLKAIGVLYDFEKENLGITND